MKKNIAKRTILLDGDVVAYKIAAKTEHAIRWDDDTWTLHADEEEGKSFLDAYVRKLASTLQAQRTVIALSVPSHECWREEIFPPYKEKRKDVRRPMILAALKQHFRDKYETWERPTLEGDDVLGILATSPLIIPGEKIVASLDKDLKTIPGLHFNLSDPKRGVFSVTETEADYQHLLQALTGDPVDEFPGCPGVGPKKAAAILDGKVEFDRVVEAYAKAGLPYEEALRQARVARITRREDYDFKAKRVIPWEPK